MMMLFDQERWRRFPKVLLGYDIQRWENPTYGDIYVDSFKRKLISWGSSVLRYGPTHLQYRSPFGFLIQWPLCFHIWWQFRGQINGKPGTERVFYFRVGWARWEGGSGQYVMEKIGFGTWYGPGLHWD